MTPLESHKQLLIAESELNRVLLLRDAEQISAAMGVVVHEVKHWGSMAGTAALVAGSVSALFRKRPDPAPGKTSWFQKLLKGARFAVSAWGMLHPTPKEKTSN